MKVNTWPSVMLWLVSHTLTCPVLTASVKVTTVSLETPPKGTETNAGLSVGPLRSRFSPAGPWAVTWAKGKLPEANSYTEAEPAGTVMGIEHWPAWTQNPGPLLTENSKLWLAVD